MDRSKLIDALRLNKDILTSFIERIPQESVVKRRKDFWTIFEHIEHLTQSQVMLYHRIEAFINETKPVIKSFMPDNKPKMDTSKSVKHLLDIFAIWRDKQAVLISACKEDIWEKKAKHPEYDVYTFETMIYHILAHDGYHMYRMEELWLLKDEFINPLV
jgi:hypothetical protein